MSTITNEELEKYRRERRYEDANFVKTRIQAYTEELEQLKSLLVQRTDELFFENEEFLIDTDYKEFEKEMRKIIEDKKLAISLKKLSGLISKVEFIQDLLYS